MKKITLALFFVLILTGCASQPVAQFVQLPDTERLAITAFVVAVVGFAFTKIAERLPWTAPLFEKYKMEISMVLSGVLIGFIENALPSAYPEISILFVQLVLAVLASIGLFRLFSRAGTPGFRE